MKAAHIFAAFACFAAALVFDSCNNGRDQIAEAEYQFSKGQYQSAQSICSELLESTRPDDMSVADLCRVAILSSQLADVNDFEANTELATLCMKTALQRNPDSVLLFVHELPADALPQSMFIRQLTRTLNPGCDNSAHTPTDSITQ